MLYEFECKECGKMFEENRLLKKNTQSAVCPECNGESKKIMSKFGFKIVGYSSINGYSNANI